VVFFERVKSDHFFHPVASFLKDSSFSLKNCRWFLRDIDASSLYSQHEISIVAEILMDVLREDSCLVRLCDVSVESVDPLDDAPVLFWKPCVSEDWGHISPVLTRVID